MSTPLVTVLMTVYNGQPYVQEAVASILSQTYRDFRFLILDNASTDNSRETIRAFGDPRIELVLLPENIGQIRALNRGLEMIDSSFVARIDSDDVSLPERFGKQVAYLNEHHYITVIGTDGKHIDSKGTIISNINYPVGFTDNLFYILIGCNPVGHPFVMYRKDAVDFVGKYRPDFKYSADVDLWLRMY